MAALRVQSASEAAAFLTPTDDLAVGLGPAHPNAFLHALGERTDWVDLQVSGALLTDLYAVFMQPSVHFRSGFFGPAERMLRDAGADIQYVPADFRRFGPILESLKPRVLATAASAPDADGYCSFSLHAGATIDAFHQAGADPDRLLIVEHSPLYPRTFGIMPDYPHRLHLDEIDVIFESQAAPVDLAEPPSDEIDLAIATHAGRYIEDGATLQTGIGAIPSLIASQLCDAPGGGYGVHSEMFTTGLMRLHQAGKVSNMNKGEFEGFSVTTFAAGTPELYTWLDGNEEVRFLPVAIVNSTDVISNNANFISINGATAVDLLGQVAADTINGRQYSGTGGHEDFLAGAGLQNDDRSLLCLRSSTMIDGVRTSRILSTAGPHMTVTTPRHQVDTIITEFGAAELKGRTVHERAVALAEIAHPDFHEELLEAAAQLR
ncbi:MAG: 4-hydroxybutyrate CoA-transferase [Actinobacteria bacterium]|nr:4-hydroxybutyrate CoA-transferase [Actinomycetota bacterium]